MSLVSGMMESRALRDNYMRWLKNLENTSDKAEKNGMTSCNKCGWCCARRPCVPTPDEVKLIANHLNLEVKEAVKKYFVADRLGGSNTAFIFPAKETQMDITGTFIDWRRTYDEGYCNFYDQKRRKCTIYSVRPKDAKNVSCWEPHGEKLHEQNTAERMGLWDEVNLEDFGIENREGDDDW